MPRKAFGEQLPGCWSREYGAELKLRTEAAGINRAYHRQRNPTDAELQEARELKKRSEIAYKASLNKVNEARRQFQMNIAIPADLMDELQDALQAVRDMEDYSKDRFSNMQKRLDALKQDAITKDGVETELRLHNQGLTTSIENMSAIHAAELAMYIKKDEVDKIRTDDNAKIQHLEQLVADYRLRATEATTAKKKLEDEMLIKENELGNHSSKNAELEKSIQVIRSNAERATNDAKQKHEKLQGEIRQTKQELNHEKDLCAEKDRQLANRKQEYEQRLLELKTTNDLALKDKVDQINKLEQKVARNEENRETLSARITSLTEQLAASKATKEQQAKQITYLEADKISLTADKETSKNEKMDLTRKIERLHCRSEDLDKDLKDLRKKHQDLENKETRGQAHTEQLETLIERAAAHRQLAQEAEQKFSDLQNSHAEELLAERNKHVTSTKDLETSHRKERGTLKTEMDTEKAKLTEVAEKYESLNTSLEHTRKQLAEKIDQGEELAKEITQLKTSVSEKESDLTTSKEGLQKAEETSLDLKNLCSTLQEELNQLGERYEELQSSTEEQISISQGDISRQQRKIFGLESRIQAGYSHNRAITQTCAVLLHETQRLSGLAAVATLSRARLREHNTEQQNYRNAIDKLLGEWQTYADGLQHSLDEANQKIASLQEDFELACSSRDQAMNDVKDVQEHRRINKAADDRSLKRLKEERKTLQASLEQKANEIEQHRMSMAKDIEEHQAQIAEIKAENDKLQEEARQATELHGSLSRNILKLRDERQNLLTALTEKTEEFERKNRESGNRATELEHKNTESANTIHRLREIQLPAYTTRIHNFENESENRMAKIRAAIGPPLEVDGETQIKDKHVDRETPQLDRLIKAKQTLDELYLQAQKQHTADAQTLKALEEQHDKLKAENVSMQQTYTSQIEWYGDRLRKWDGKLREVRDEYDQYRRDVLAFKQQVEARRQVTDADLDALIGYFNDRRQGLDTAFPELKAKTHKAWTEPLPNV